MELRNSMIRVFALAAVLPVLSATQSGCARTQSMQSSAALPASQGTVKATNGDNGNTNVLVKVKHLAPPERVAPGAKVYVVWIQPANDRPQSVGALTVDDDLEGTLETVTPHRRFTLTVTPEASGQAAYPTHAAVFSSQIDRD